MGLPARDLLIRDVRTALAGVSSDERVTVHVADGRIAAVVRDGESIASLDAQGAATIEGAGLWALPGWIDLQVNDIEWLSRGLQTPQEHAARVRDVLRYQSSRGVTGCVLATLAAPLDEIVAYLGGMRRVLDGETALDRVFVGALVEGTFMNPAFHGAHNPDWVLAPDEEVLDRLLATGAVRLINIAPETSPDAIALIERATRAGVVVGCGHAKPHAERVREAVAAGPRGATT